MKKVLSLVLALSIVVFGSSLAASAAEISLATDNLGRGAGDSTVVANDDGSITTATSNISFLLPEAVKGGETVTVTMKGSSDGDFRVWLIDVNEVTNSNIYQMSQNDFTSGDFDKTFDLTATAEATELFFKAPSWDAKINNLTITELTVTTKDTVEAEEITADEEEAEAEEAEAVEADVVEADVVEADVVEAAAELPKTGETSNAVLYMAFMGLAAVGIVVSKKKLVKE